MNLNFLFVKTCVFVLLSVIVFGQQTFLSFFKGVQVSQTIFISFTINGGNTCTGIGIERSVDGKHFQGIGETPGICGSSFSEMAYSFTDHTPVPNTRNHYRVELGIRSGFYSDTISVNYVDLNAYGFKVFPNPAIHQSVIYFLNPKKELFDLRIFNQRGELILQKSLKENFAELNDNNFSAGIYHYHLSMKNEIKYIGTIIFLYPQTFHTFAPLNNLTTHNHNNLHG